jgi:hypothetical protein
MNDPKTLSDEWDEIAALDLDEIESGIADEDHVCADNMEPTSHPATYMCSVCGALCDRLGDFS